MHRGLFLIGALVSLAGCSTGPRVRADVSRGDAAAQLSIRLSSSDSALAPVPVDLIQVNDRHGARAGGAGQVLWTVPNGYGSTGPAPMLPMGDYEVRVNAGGVWSVTPFRITALNVIE
jgi:hypothetical protein